jgi:hypothetical protein
MLGIITFLSVVALVAVGIEVLGRDDIDNDPPPMGGAA